MFGILLFIALIIADIVRIFMDNEEFDGIMLFARPIVAFVGALLCGGTFWTALLWAVGWGVVGFIAAALISEHFGDACDNSSNAQTECTAFATQSSPNPVTSSGSFTFAKNILSEHDKYYRNARASNGVVYCRYVNKESPIGYYEWVDDGRCVNIYREHDKGLIGCVSGDEIFLSRQVMYDRACKVRDEYGGNYSIKIPIPMTLNVAEIQNGCIRDNNNGACLGTYQGNKYAAASVFVCLIYECLMEYEYHRFYFYEGLQC